MTRVDFVKLCGLMIVVFVCCGLAGCSTLPTVENIGENEPGVAHVVVEFEHSNEALQSWRIRFAGGGK